MKFTTYTTFPEQTSNESLWVLVDSEQLQSNVNTYQINNLESVLTATQFKGNFNETLPLFGQISNQPHSQLLGLGKTAELQTVKLAKLAQTIIKSTQNKFKHIAIDIAALPVEHHYLFALSLTQAAYGYDEFKSKKNEFVLQQVDLISSTTSLDEQQLALVHAVQSGHCLLYTSPSPRDS